MKILSVVGARPQFVKLGPLARALGSCEAARRGEVVHVIAHTGQHYDRGMSDVFFGELGLPEPTWNLGIGSGPHGRQTGAMLAQLEDVFLDAKPDVVVVYGDTNSTLAGALAAAKLHLRVAHVEAGVRSFNRRMPEEVNRVAVDHVSDLLLCPTVTAMENLASEGLGSRAVLTGDVMYDSVMGTLEIAEQRSSVIERLGLVPRGYALVTVHRAENTDDATRLAGLLEAFNRIAAQGTRVVFPVHPRTSAVMGRELRGWTRHPLLDLIEPVGYLDMLRLLRHARLALTDSGGVQKEAFFVGCPCITLRGETEWVETVERGGNVLAGVGPDEILAAVAAWESRLVAGVPDIFFLAAECFGGGRAAENIVRALLARGNE